MPSDKKLQAK
jgi:chromosome segregation ATPase